ncbi:hypothetical protein [Anabaena catenula]|nr:hypothetical protein [Anabaena catenula]
MKPNIFNIYEILLGYAFGTLRERKASTQPTDFRILEIYNPSN